jgi:NAD(P)-dependent dehydrogenase (short-subunit alcohol dehydrogenase family)
LDPKGKVALITGGARIGHVVGVTLSARGCALALTYRNSRQAAEATAEAARAAGVAAAVIRADVGDETQIKAAVNETVRALGRLDILVNLAGTYDRAAHPSAADWSAAIDSNARSGFLFAIAAAPIMKSGGGGRVINFSDWLPASGRPRYREYVPYYTSKAAVVAMTQSLALDLAPEILVNAIAPGPILAPPDLNAQDNAEVLDSTPLRRWGGAEEIAKAVMFLIETEFVTGECIRVDGGRHLV